PAAPAPPPWRRLARRAPVLLLPLGGLALWQALVWLLDAEPWLVPPPAEVAAVLVDERARLWFHAQATLSGTLVGFALAVLAGVGLAAAIAGSRVVEGLTYPWVVASQAVPILSIAPVMTIWLDYRATQVVIATVVCIFPVIVTAVDGLRGADPQLGRTMRTLGASRRWTWWHVTVPSALPSLFSGLRMAAVFAVSGAVVSEYVGAERGLGYLTEISTAQFETAVAVAAIAWLTAIGVALFGLVTLAERLALPHRHRPARRRRRSRA
ncbi:MAG TPA: ABC transporter permease, partial [Miltoncostaeaceae bacterium]|nr:ABC transporter permease [Miltoncostaeaceae bacterium]